jgi:hypothetical protein
MEKNGKKITVKKAKWEKSVAKKIGTNTKT